MWHVWEKGEVHTGCTRGDLKERDHSKDLGVGRSILLKLILDKWNREHGLD
jgi:hypothetical protein